MKTKMEKHLFPITITLLATLSAGCASITGTTNQSISVQAREQQGKEVSGAACELTNAKGKWFVTTPGSVAVTRSNDDMQVLCNKQGSEPGRASVVSATKGAMFGNIIFGGGIGAIIDHNSGAAYEYPSLIQVLMGTFTKIEPPSTSAAQGQTGGSPDPSGQPAAAIPAKAVAPALTSSASNEVGIPAPVAAAPSSSIPPGQSASAADRLRDLNKLHKDGLINQMDFDSKKQEILKAM